MCNWELTTATPQHAISFFSSSITGPSFSGVAAIVRKTAFMFNLELQMDVVADDMEEIISYAVAGDVPMIERFKMKISDMLIRHTV